MSEDLGYIEQIIHKHVEYLHGRIRHDDHLEQSEQRMQYVSMLHLHLLLVWVQHSASVVLQVSMVMHQAKHSGLSHNDEIVSL